MNSQPWQIVCYTITVFLWIVLPHRGYCDTWSCVLAKLDTVRMFAVQLDYLTDGVSPCSLGLNSPWCHSQDNLQTVTGSRLDPRDLAETMTANNLYQPESRWSDVCEVTSTKFYFRVHWQRINIYFTKIYVWHNKILNKELCKTKGERYAPLRVDGFG